VDYLPHVAAHVRARLAAEIRRATEAGAEDALDG